MAYSAIAPFYDKIFPFRPVIIDFLASFYAPESRLIDLGCGTGSYANALCEADYNCIGVDLDEEMINRGLQKYPEVRLNVGNILDFTNFRQNFDGAFCLGNVAAYLDENELRKILAQIYQNLSKNGTWIVQTMNWDYVLSSENYEFPDVLVEDTEGVMVKFRRWYGDITPKGLKFHRQLLRDGKSVYHGVDTLYPQKSAEFIKLHKEFGFKLAGHFADYKKSPFDTKGDSAAIFVFNK